MSYGLLIKYLDPQKDTAYIPIAAYDTFVRYWKPAADKLSLRLIWLFDVTVSDLSKDIPAIIEQLGRLKDYMKTTDDIPRNEADHIIRRIEGLVPALEDVQQNQNEIEWVSIG